MHKVTVTPLPAAVAEEPIEVGSYWQSRHNTATWIVVGKHGVAWHIACLLDGRIENVSETCIRSMTRLRNVKIEIEVQ